MAGFSSIAAGIGALAAAGSGIAANVAQNKARAQARHQMQIQMENFRKDLANRQNEFNALMNSAEKTHSDNMDIANRTFERDKKFMQYQLQQGEAGLHLQMKALAQARDSEERALNNSVAQMQRTINMNSPSMPMAVHKKDNGVSGTILTGPSGVDKNKIKKGSNTVLGR